MNYKDGDTANSRNSAAAYDVVEVVGKTESGDVVKIVRAGTGFLVFCGAKYRPFQRSYKDAQDYAKSLVSNSSVLSANSVVANALAWKRGVGMNVSFAKAWRKAEEKADSNGWLHAIVRRGIDDPWYLGRREKEENTSLCKTFKTREEAARRMEDENKRLGFVWSGGSWKRNVANTNAYPACNAVTDWEKTYTIKGIPVKLVYRGAPYSDIKATVVGGNLDYVLVARCTMSNPPDQAGAEKLVAPVWSKVKRTAKNAEDVCNAKFKVGDKVYDADHHAYGEVVGFSHFPIENYIVELSNGREVYVHPDNVSAANSSCSAANAWPSRYKVGDKVKFETRTAAGDGVVGMERGYSPSIRSMRTGVITKDIGRGKWEIKASDGGVIQVDEADFMGFNSTAPVVNAALAWKKANG